MPTGLFGYHTGCRWFVICYEFYENEVDQTGHVGVRTYIWYRVLEVVVEIKMMLMAIIIVVLLANNHTVTAFTCFCRVQQAYHKLYSSIKDDNDLLCASDPSSQIIATPIQLISKDEYDHINELVNKRSEARWNGDYNKADNIRTAIDDLRVSISLSQIIQTIQHGMDISIPQIQEDVKIQYKVLVTDYPRSVGGSSSWELEPIINPLLDNIDETEDNVLQLAHASLGLAVSSSEKGVNVNKDVMNELISRTNNRLRVLKQRRELSIFLPGAAVGVGELHGRKAADAILWFALAGVDDDDLFNNLLDIARIELNRFGRNTSCRPKDILHIVERAAMAATTSYSTNQLYITAADCLEYKMKERTNHDINSNDIDWGNLDYRNIIQELRDGSFGLHSDRSLLGLWRFSSRQRKQKQFLYNAARHFEHTREGNTTEDFSHSNQYNWAEMYTDPSRPLIIDMGCGMGVSLLGLASSQSTKQLPSINHSELQINWIEHNFLGVDLSRLAIGNARGACRRFGLSSDLHFVVDSAENCLRHISESYPGDVALSMIQFPTPYKFQYENEEVSPSVAKRGFNSQLPSSASDNFMVSENLVKQICNMLSENNGKLLIQSNCEDVSVYMRNLARKVGFRSIPFTDSVKELDPVTERAKKWVECGGERPIGKYWSANSLLPQKGRTETEVACSIDNKPVHRCLLKATDD